MAVNGLNSSTLRLSGLTSGFDTDSVVSALLMSDKAKIDKLKQNRDLSQWRTEAYRDITSSLQGFYKEFLDTLSSTNLNSANLFSSNTAAFVVPSSSEYLSITSGAGAKLGTYTISDIVAAKAATISGGVNVSNPISTGVITDADVSSMDNSAYNNIFSFNFNGKSYKITLDDSKTSVAGLVEDLQAKINSSIGLDAEGTAKVQILSNSGKLTFKVARETDVFSIGTVNNDGAGKLFSVVPSETSPFVLNAGNNQFQLNIGTTTKLVVTVPINADGSPKEFKSPEDLKTAIQSAIDTSFTEAGIINPGISAEVKNGKVQLKSTSTQAFSTGYVENRATNTLLHIDYSKISNKVSLSAKISDIAEGLKPNPVEKNPDGTYKLIKFTINGKEISIDPTISSINDVIRKVNSDTSINATISYNQTTNSFSIKSNNTGVTERLIISDVPGGGTLMATLGLVTTAEGVSGSDSSVKVTNPDGTSNIIVRSNNAFSYDGLSITINKDLPTDANPIKFTVSGDTSKPFNVIKGFVEKYNSLIDKLNSKIGEKRNTDYVPLTDSQKEAMSEEQIKQWETKAKTGLLSNDTLIKNVLSQLRSALYEKVDGAGLSLYNIGITTSSDYTAKGKLVIDETKLKNALANNPGRVTDLFTAKSDISYGQVINGTGIREDRFKQSGLAQRLSDIIQDSIRTTTDQYGRKGALLEKAGITGDRSEQSNVLFKEVTEFNKMIYELNNRLIDKENSLYAKFSAMEAALNKMNSQQSWLSQQLGK